MINLIVDKAQNPPPAAETQDNTKKLAEAKEEIKQVAAPAAVLPSTQVQEVPAPSSRSTAISSIEIKTYFN